MVRQVMGWLEGAPDQDTKIEMIKTLQALTEGKVIGPLSRTVTKMVIRTGIGMVTRTVNWTVTMSVTMPSLSLHYLSG